MSILSTSYDPKSGIYSYKKDGQWFFSTCPPDQIASRRVDGKWYFVELCVGSGGGGDSDVSKMYVDSQDQKLQANIDKCFSDSKDYANSIVADYALVSYVDEQIGAIEIPEAGDGWDGGRIQFTSGSAEEVCLYGSDDITYISFVPNSTGDFSSDVRLVVRTNSVLVTGCPLDTDGQRVVNVGNPTQATDAVNQQVAKFWDNENLQASKKYTDEQIGGLDISVDLSDYASQEWVLDQSYVTEQPVTDGDAATLASANEYTDAQIGAIEIPEGADLSKYAETSYVDGADQAVQRFAVSADQAILEAANLYTDNHSGSGDVDKAYVDAQDATKIGNTGDQNLPSSTWKLRARKADDSGAYSYISIQDDQLKLYHVADPTADAHGMSRGYADARYQFIQRQIVFKCDQYAKCSTSPNPAAGEFCGLNNSSPGSSTSPNPYFGNWNVGIRIAADKLLNPEGNQFTDMERYTIEGTVTVLDKTGKLFFKSAVHSVTRTNNNSYVDINFGSRVPAFGTGSYDSSDQYVVLVEGLETVQPTTTNIPED